MSTVVGSTLSTGNPAKVNVQLAWSQYDASGICSESGYVIAYDNNGNGNKIAQFYDIQTSVQFQSSTSANYYEVYVQAYDCSPNQNLGIAVDYYSGPTIVQEGAATYSPGWTTSNCACFSGGSDEHNAKAGASASYQFRGNGIGFVTEKASNRGTAQVYIDGKLKATVNNKISGSPINSVVGFAYYNNSYGTHTLKIVVKSGRVDVDAFLVA